MIEIFTVDSCPKCVILKEKMKSKNIDFEGNKNIKELIKLGFMSAPILKIESGEYLDFGKANTYINSL